VVFRAAQDRVVFFSRCYCVHSYIIIKVLCMYIKSFQRVIMYVHSYFSRCFIRFKVLHMYARSYFSRCNYVWRYIHTFQVVNMYVPTFHYFQGIVYIHTFQGTFNFDDFHLTVTQIMKSDSYLPTILKLFYA
jgi:hypothetical protein